jgi:hypothetical protein
MHAEKSDKKNSEDMSISAFFAFHASVTAQTFSSTYHFQLVDFFLLSLEPCASCKRFPNLKTLIS